jgi:hypothetical protein
MRYLKRFFESENFDFFKSIENPEQSITYDFLDSNYNSVDKSVVCAYMIVDQTEDYVKVLNLIEKNTEPPSVKFFDGATGYTFYINYVTIPTSQIEIIGPAQDKPGFTFIRIPYWLYKNNPGLKIQRIKVKKRFKNADRHAHLNKMMIDDNVKKYLSVTDKEEQSNKNMSSFIK